jgi:phage baseplate assembly protein W
MSTYRGFSTKQRLNKFTLTDLELVKQDLLNALNTRRGSRVMQPQEGCIVWERMFDPITDSTKTEIIYDLTRICQRDPRITLDSINLIERDNSLEFQLEITYLPEDKTETMIVWFDTGATEVRFK